MQNSKDECCKTVLRLLVLDVTLSTSEAKPENLETVLSGPQKISSTTALLVRPTGPHWAILVRCPKCVQIVRASVGKLSMVRLHDVTRFLNDTVRPNYISH